MRVMVAGATGVVGRNLILRLVAAGHQVVGLTRSPAKIAWLESVGAIDRVVDGLDGPAVRAIALESRPEAIVHEMTALANASDLIHFDRAFATTNRLRTEGVDHLIAAAEACGARRFVAQSFCGWPYARTGGWVKSEEAPLDPDPPPEMARTLAAIRHLESAVLESAALEGVVLRYGAFYGPRTGLFGGGLVEQLRRRRAPIIGDGGGFWSFLHVEDAAEATAIAVERGAGGRYNIADDEPAPVREWLPALGAMLGAKPPRRVPRWLGRIAAGEHMVALMTEARAGSNLKAKEALGWRPTHASWRQGFAEALAAMS